MSNKTYEEWLAEMPTTEEAPTPTEDNVSNRKAERSEGQETDYTLEYDVNIIESSEDMEVIEFGS